MTQYWAEILKMFAEILPVLIGGLCAITGGFLSTWYLSKKARKIRFEETIAEKQVEICREALSAIGYLRSLLLQGTLEDSLNFMSKRDKWFWDSRAFLPHKFLDNWLSIKLYLQKVVRTQKNRTGENAVEKIDKYEEFINKLACDAETEILSVLSLPPITIHHLPKT